LLIEMIIGLVMMGIVLVNGLPALHHIQNYWQSYASDLINQQETNYISQFVMDDFKTITEINDISEGYISFTTLEGNIIEYDLKNNRLRQKQNGRTNYLTQHLHIEEIKFEKLSFNLISLKIITKSTESTLVVVLPNVTS